MTAAKNGSRSTRSPRASGTSGAPDRAARRAADGSRLEDVLGGATRYVKELISSAKELIEIKTERKKLQLRRALIRAAVGVVALIGVAAWLGSAVSATIRGLCMGLAQLFDGRVWLGDLVGGLLALALLAGGVAYALRLAERKEIQRLEAKYGGRQPDEPPHAGGAPGADGSRDAAPALQGDAALR